MSIITDPREVARQYPELLEEVTTLFAGFREKGSLMLHDTETGELVCAFIRGKDVSDSAPANLADLAESRGEVRPETGPALATHLTDTRGRLRKAR